jgi:hypothetical protein
MSYLSYKVFTSDTELNFNNQFKVYFLDCTSNNVTITLPLDCGLNLRFIRIDATGNTCTISCNSGQTFLDTTTSKTIASSGDIMNIYVVNNIWYNI